MCGQVQLWPEEASTTLARGSSSARKAETPSLLSTSSLTPLCGPRSRRRRRVEQEERVMRVEERMMRRVEQELLLLLLLLLEYCRLLLLPPPPLSPWCLRPRLLQQ